MAGLLLRGFALLVPTIGLYRFWLTTWKRRFYWSHTEIGGDALEYTGNALQLLLGFLMALAVFVPLYGLFFYLSTQSSEAAIVGYGGVGKAIEDRLLPFETTVTKVASRERTDPRGHVHGIAELHTLLPEHDIVIVGVPLSDATRHLIDDAFLAAMPDGALLVNVARGPVADTDALVRHTGSGRIRAALDVTDPEPLPQDHPLWRIPGVIISPHVGGASSAMRPRMGKLVQRQIELMLAGEPPANVVLGG